VGKPALQVDAKTRDVLVGRTRKSVPDVVAIYVYGSRVTGRLHSASDLDLALLVPRGAHPPVNVLLELRGDLESLTHLPVDVSLLDLESQLVHCKEVVTGGIAIYESDPNAVAEFEMRVLGGYARLSEDRRPVLAAYTGTARG
jgi:predicted nucleotidyltransferase